MATLFVDPNPVFRPQRMVITGITQSNPTVVTTSTDHNYATGLIVRLVIPTAAGMQQIHNKTVEITVTGNATFSVNIDSLSFDAYVDPPDSINCGQVSPVGENNSILTMATQNVLT